MDLGLYQKHRPKKLSEVIGQTSAVKVIEGLLRGDTFPKAVLFSGPSGSGKTTIARILKTQLGCKDADFFERNCADFRGIDSVREIRQAIGLKPLGGGRCRIWLIDEAHQLTSDAQEGMLKLLEDAPGHVHFFLATTNAVKLKATIRTRCTDIILKPVGVKELAQLVALVGQYEGTVLTDEVCDRIAETADGSPRKALVILESVLGIEGEDAQLEAIERADNRAVGEFIGKVLLNPRVTWPEVVSSLREVTNTEAESIRHGVLGYCQGILLSEKPNAGIMPRAYLVLSIFRYDLFASGKPGLTAACWEVVHSGKK